MKARDHLDDAKANLAGGRPGVAAICAEFALVNAADAKLQQDGWRIRGKTSSHEARFDYPALPEVFAQNMGLINRVRAMRNEEAYGGSHPVTVEQARDMVALAERAIVEIAVLIP